MITSVTDNKKVVTTLLLFDVAGKFTEGCFGRVGEVVVINANKKTKSDTSEDDGGVFTAISGEKDHSGRNGVEKVAIVEDGLKGLRNNPGEENGAKEPGDK